jgi:hypothetical protein
MTYWTANFLHDWPIFFVNICCIMLCICIIGYIQNNSSNEVYYIGTNSSLMGQLFFLFFLSSFSWCILCYIWSFMFKSDIVGFIVMFIGLSFVSFVEGVLSFMQLLFNGSGPAKVFSIVRGIMALFFPNITVKRGLYNLKIQSNSFCISSVNTYLGG